MDYRGYRTRLLTPLGAMIVSARNGSPTGLNHFREFDRNATETLEAIAGQTSPQAVILRASISNVREAWPLRDVAALERERLRLLEIR